MLPVSCGVTEPLPVYQPVHIPMIRASVCDRPLRHLDAIGTPTKDIDRLLRANHLSRELINSSSAIHHGQFLGLLQDSAKLIGDPFFGGTIGQEFSVEAVNGFGESLIDPLTCGEAIACFMSTLNTYYSEAHEFGFINRGGTVTILINHPARRCAGDDLTFQNAVLFLIDLLRHYQGDEWCPDKVCLRGPKTKYWKECEAIATSQKIYHCEFGAIEFNSRLLGSIRPIAKPSASWDKPELNNDFIEAVKQLIEMLVIQRRISLESVAAVVGMSGRSLQRQLLAHGTSFAQVRDDVLYELAQTQIAEGTVIEDVALTLGYKSQSAFSRAFKRKTGTTPSIWRDLHNSVKA